MTAVFTVQLRCAHGCNTFSNHECHGWFPDRPEETSATDLRGRAKERGWEVLRHTTGRDVCPPCRIAEIRAASEPAA